ncbi:MAG: FadR family transcriptional regulator [Burkholderiales bacterium]|nr:FadR family transcriptional regulator [Burkholderiales bacterium]
MPLHTIESRRLYRQIADQIRAGIHAGEYPAGSRLPAERDLAQQLGVSRPSVREALIALEVEGLVDVRVGSGVHVLDGTAAARSGRRLGNACGPFEIMHARRVVEGELAAIAARRMTRSQLAGLRAVLGTMAADIAAGHMPLLGDRQFHLRVAEAADNGPLLRTVTELYDERNNPLFETFGQHFESERTWRLALAEHEAVVEAIAARNAEAARQAMQRHLQRSQHRYAHIAVDAIDAPAATPRLASAPPPQARGGALHEHRMTRARSAAR